MYLVSIDPGLVSSGTGLAIFEDGKLVNTAYVHPNKKTWQDPAAEVLLLLAEYLKVEAEFVVEESFYPGKANKLHQRYIGVLQFHFPEIKFIAPASVKKIVAGHGRATKDQIREILLEKYPKKSHPTVHEAVDWDNEDVVDAIAIGLAYMEREK